MAAPWGLLSKHWSAPGELLCHCPHDGGHPEGVKGPYLIILSFPHYFCQNFSGLSCWEGSRVHLPSIHPVLCCPEGSCCDYQTSHSLEIKTKVQLLGHICRVSRAW